MTDEEIDAKLQELLHEVARNPRTVMIGDALTMFAALRRGRMEGRPMTGLRRVPIKSTPSRRKRAFDAEYAKLLPGVLARGCEFSTYALRSNPTGTPLMPGTWPCDGRLVGHHAKGRKVADANDHLICLCSEHHTFAHAHPRWAREVGLMLSRTS